MGWADKVYGDKVVVVFFVNERNKKSTKIQRVTQEEKAAITTLELLRIREANRVTKIQIAYPN